MIDSIVADVSFERPILIYLGYIIIAGIFKFNIILRKERNSNKKCGNKGSDLLTLIKGKSANKTRHHADFFPLPSEIAAAVSSDSSSDSSSNYNEKIHISFRSVLLDLFSPSEETKFDDKPAFAVDGTEEDFFSLKHYSPALPWKIKKEQRQREQHRQTAKGNGTSALEKTVEGQDYFEPICFGDEVVIVEDSKEEEDLFSKKHYNTHAIPKTKNKKKCQLRKLIQQREKVEESNSSSRLKATKKEEGSSSFRFKKTKEEEGSSSFRFKKTKKEEGSSSFRFKKTKTEDSNSSSRVKKKKIDSRKDYYISIDVIEKNKKVDNMSLKKRMRFMKNKFMLPMDKLYPSTESFVKQDSFKLKKQFSATRRRQQKRRSLTSRAA